MSKSELTPSLATVAKRIAAEAGRLRDAIGAPVSAVIVAAGLCNCASSKVKDTK